ncbi:hypothetical protein ACIG8S_24760 [[Kitasatospora] papulosa]|uniref:hypothetical protein n=1 Tax=[Kitasatospora] papulosa TaxID=1464011 RepID=UPI0037D4F6E7
MSPTPTNPTDRLRAAIEEALLTTRRTGYDGAAAHGQHRYDARCALCAADVEALTEAVVRRVLGTPTTNTETPAPAADLPAVLREAADDLTALAAPDSERGTGVRWAADHLRHKADQVDTGGDDEVDDTLHACPDRWAGPNCRCFDADTVEQPDEQPLTAAQREYVTAQYDLFQLAAHGHYTYAPLHDRKTGAYLSTQQIKAGQQDYNDRLRAAQARSEAATIRAAADWLRTEYPGPDLDAHIRRAADALDRYAALPAP